MTSPIRMSSSNPWRNRNQSKVLPLSSSTVRHPVPEISKQTSYLPWGAKLMTLECGMRFLTDHLVGDHYFHISREGQNLDRCRTQCKLVKDMEDRWAELEAIVAQYGAHT